MRIAALDDDALQLDLFKQALHAMGHTCHTYLTGAQLLHSLQSECFDLFIVDWHLPDTTGAYSTRWRTRFHADGGQCSSVMADSVPR